MRPRSISHPGTKNTDEGSTFLLMEGFPPRDKNQKQLWELGHREQSIKEECQPQCKERPSTAEHWHILLTLMLLTDF